jgi:hypothetical protein
MFRRRKSFRTSPDPESAQAILICEIFALILADNLQLGKRSTNGFCAPKRKTRLVQFRLAEPLSEKSQKQLIPATQNRFSGGTFTVSECSIYYLFFSINYSFLLSFSRPPGEYLKTKNPFTLLNP